MFSFIKNLFSSKKKKIKNLTSEVIAVRTVVKNNFYHEIVGDTVRIYSRKTGLVEENLQCKDPIPLALTKLQFYNKRGN